MYKMRYNKCIIYPINYFVYIGGSYSLNRDNSSTFKRIDDSLLRDPFENYNQFKARVENLKAIVVGRAEILTDTYDRESGVCFVNVEWYNWRSLEVIKFDYFYFVLPQKSKDFINSFGDRYILIANFIVKGEKVYIDPDSIKLFIDDLELKVYTISLIQQPFETDEEFKGKIEDIRTMPLGTVTIDKSKYDINTGAFEIDVNFDTIREAKIPEVKSLYTIIKKEDVTEFYKSNVQSVLYGKFAYINGEIVVDIDSLHILHKDNKIKVFSVILDDMYFDTEEQYSNQISSLGNLCIGKASLLVEKYDRVKEILPLHIKWCEWIKEYAGSIREQYIEADRKMAKSLYEAGEKYSVYVQLKKDNGNLIIDKIRLRNFIGEIEVKFKDVFKSINSVTFDESIPIKDIVDYNDEIAENNYNVQEKFEFVKGIALVKLNGNYTYINEHGDVLGLINKRLMRFINSKGKYGYMDNVERVTIIQPEYDYIGSFEDGLSRISINNKWGYIDETGNMVIKPVYEFARDFHDGYAAVKIRSIVGTRWGYINKEGEVVISPKYDEAGEFSNGIAYVRIKSIVKGIREGFIYENGEFHDYVKNIV